MKTNSILAVACITAAVMACGKPRSAQLKTFVDSKRDVQFEYPADWSIEEMTQQDVLLLSSPVQEANWQTNIFLGLRRDLEAAQPVGQRLATLAENLGKHKKGFVPQSSRAFTHMSGLSAGELVYTHAHEGMPLTERELVLRLRDGRTLFVTGSAITSLWGKYEGEMNVVFNSVRPLGK